MQLPTQKIAATFTPIMYRLFCLIFVLSGWVSNPVSGQFGSSTAVDSTKQDQSDVTSTDDLNDTEKTDENPNLAETETEGPSLASSPEKQDEAPASSAQNEPSLRAENGRADMSQDEQGDSLAEAKPASKNTSETHLTSEAYPNGLNDSQGISDLDRSLKASSSNDTSSTEVDQIIFWSSVGVAGAGLITGSILGGLAISQQTKFKENPTTKKADHGERLALFADVSFGFSAVAAVTAAMIYLSDEEDSKDSSDASETPAENEDDVSWNVAPSFSPQQATITGQLHF